MDNGSYCNLPEKLPVFSDSAPSPLTRAFCLDPMGTFHLCPGAPAPPPYSEDLPLLPLATDSLVAGNRGAPCPCPLPVPCPLGGSCDHSAAPASLRKRNERERRRVRCVNEGYARLRQRLPADCVEKRLSKVETLRAAIKYIAHLRSLLCADKAEPENIPGKVPSVAATSRHAEPTFRII